MLCNHGVLVLLSFAALLVFAFSVWGCLISLVFCMSELTYVLVDVDDAVSGFGFCCGLRCPLTARRVTPRLWRVFCGRKVWRATAKVAYYTVYTTAILYVRAPGYRPPSASP